MCIVYKLVHYQSGFSRLVFMILYQPKSTSLGKNKHMWRVDSHPESPHTQITSFESRRWIYYLISDVSPFFVHPPKYVQKSILLGTNKYPKPFGTFESMMFLFFRGRICDRSLVPTNSFTNDELQVNWISIVSLFQLSKLSSKFKDDPWN